MSIEVLNGAGCSYLSTPAPKLSGYKTSKGEAQFPYKSFGTERLALIAEIAAWCGKAGEQEQTQFFLRLSPHERPRVRFLSAGRLWGALRLPPYLMRLAPDTAVN